jgi:hypothetical protein
MPFDYSTTPGFPNPARLNIGSDPTSAPHDNFMYGGRRPGSSLFEKGKDTPMEGYSVASKTIGEPTRLDRAKSYVPWPGRRRKQQEQEAAARLDQEVQKQQLLQRQVDEQAAILAQMQIDQKRDETARQLREAEEERMKQREREAAERQLEMEMQAEYDRRRELEQSHKTSTPDALRNLRELIRTRYELDMEIYRMRHVRGPDRPLVLQKMQRADALLAEILAIVNTWEQNPVTWDKREWELAVDIRNRLLADNKRKWANNPPWNDD